MNERWMWVMRYVIVIVLALALAWVLGDMALFKTMRFGKTGVTAARLAQLLGYGGAMVVFWLFAHRGARRVRRMAGCRRSRRSWQGQTALEPGRARALPRRRRAASVANAPIATPRPNPTPTGGR